LGAGLGIGTVCARDGITIAPIDVAISNAKAIRIEGNTHRGNTRHGNTRGADRELFRHSMFLISSQRIVLPGCSPFYRAFRKRKYRFYVKGWRQFASPQFL
jgi:hypothetical protein